MRADTETALARAVAVFGVAYPHTAYLFANKRGTRLKALVYDDMGIWLALRRLHQGRFDWPSPSGMMAFNSANQKQEHQSKV